MSADLNSLHRRQNDSLRLIMVGPAPSSHDDVVPGLIQQRSRSSAENLIP